MAFDAFLKIDGIDGESSDRDHKAWIELLSFNWGAAGAEAAGAGGGGSAGRVSPQAFSFMKVTDSASPKIFLKTCVGTHFQKVSLSCRKAGGEGAGGRDDFLKIDFFDVFFSAYTTGGNRGTDQQPLESISFAFLKTDFQVAAISADGTLGDVSRGGFDFRTNKPLRSRGDDDERAGEK